MSLICSLMYAIYVHRGRKSISSIGTLQALSKKCSFEHFFCFKLGGFGSTVIKASALTHVRFWVSNILFIKEVFFLNAF